MHRASLICAALAACLGIAACDDTVPPPSETPAVQAVSPSAYLVRGHLMAAYQRASDTGLTPQMFADATKEPALVAQLARQRFRSGAQIDYTQAPQGVVVPFAEVITRAFIFNDTAGAVDFFTTESERNQQAQGGATLTALSNLPRNNVDQILALEQSSPAPGADSRAYFGLARRGRVVIELFARINVNATTTADFLTLFAAQESLLATSPD